MATEPKTPPPGGELTANRSLMIGRPLEYRPANPNYGPKLGLIGCGGITKEHLAAYQNAGWDVAGMVDIRIDAAEAMRDRFFPNASVYTDYRDLLRDEAIEVVDVATHPEVRPAIVRDCLEARRHVLSQKPFVLDLDEGERLVELAHRRGVALAVNQNGRFAPHFSYLRQAVSSGLLGQTFAAHLSCHWDHSWVRGTAFEKIKHLILYDYAIHWFDIVRCFLPESQPQRVYASTTRVPPQQIEPAMAAQVAIEFDNAQATLAFDAHVPFGQQDRTYIAGTRATATSNGPSIQEQQVTLIDGQGSYTPKLVGRWFPVGFQGTMAELLLSIEENRPSIIDGLMKMFT
jgi:predicted dehydrogenase